MLSSCICRGPGQGAPPSFAMSHEALVAADPDFIVICPCGLDLEQTCTELPALTTQPWWCVPCVWRSLTARERMCRVLCHSQMPANNCSRAIHLQHALNEQVQQKAVTGRRRQMQTVSLHRPWPCISSATPRCSTGGSKAASQPATSGSRSRGS